MNKVIPGVLVGGIAIAVFVLAFTNPNLQEEDPEFGIIDFDPELTSTAPEIQISPEPVPELGCLGTAQCYVGTVTKIVDGDTIHVDGQSVRFSLSSASEMKEISGVESRNFIETICPVGSLAIVDEDDGQVLGSYGRLVGKITCNDVNLNSELLDANLGYLEVRFCESSEFSSEPWAVKHGCE